MSAPRPPWVVRIADGLPDAARRLQPWEQRGRGQGRPAAVLVCFSPGAEATGATAGRSAHQPGDVLLLERSATLRAHAGQPAFPGGAVDPGDGGPVAAALREAREETGLDPAGVEVLGTLPSLLLPPSGFRVTPVVAWEPSPSPVGVADPGEVVRVLRAPLAELVDPGRRVEVTWRRPATLPGAKPGRTGGRTASGSDDADRRGPGFEVGGLLVWGFTANLLSALLASSGLERPWEGARSVPAPLPPPRAVEAEVAP